MLKIKNKLVNTKELKRQKRLKRYIETKKKIRLKTKKIFPLTKQEEILYDNHQFESHMSTLNKNEFFKTAGNIILLDIYPKSNFNSFLDGAKQLLLQNPSKNPFTHNPIEEDFHQKMFHWQDSRSWPSHSIIGYCSPNSKELLELIDYIRIDIFNFSNDYLALSFNLTFSDSFKNEINQHLNSTEKYDFEVYKKYSYNKKKYIGKYSYNQEIVRRKKLENKIIEVKCRVHKFISKYISLTPIHDMAPISLDFYYTNINDRHSSFLNSYDFYFREKDIHTNLSLIHNFKDGHQNFVEHDYILPLFVSHNTINRSVNLLIIDSIDNCDKISLLVEDLQDILIIVLYMQLLEELNSFTSLARNLVEQNYSKVGIKFNHFYNKLSSKIFKFNLIFNDVCKESCTLTQEYINETHIHLNNYKNKLFKKHEIIENASKDKISISNYNVSFWLSFISIVIAIIAFITSLFFDASPDYNNEFHKLQEEQQDIYEELTNIYNEQKDLNNKISNIIKNN